MNQPTQATTTKTRTPATLTGSAIEQRIAETVAQQRSEDRDGLVAAATPYPGAAAAAFAVPESVRCGPYEVRPFYDADFELLAAIKSPMYEMVVADVAADDKRMGDLEDQLARGQHAWNYFHLLTTPAEQADEVIRAGKLEEFMSEARKRFGRLQAAAIAELHRAALHQFRTYTRTVVRYSPAAAEGGEQNPPDSSARQPTG